MTSLGLHRPIAGSALLALAAAPCASGDEWVFAPSAGAYADVNSNPRLQYDDPQAVAGVVSELGTALALRRPAMELRLEPRVIVREYTGDDALDSVDTYVDAGFDTTRERARYSLTGRYASDETVTGEFSETAASRANVPRQSVVAEAGARWLTSEASDLTTRLSYEDVRYEQGLRYGLVDYRYLSAAAIGARSVSEQTRVSLIGRIARLEADQISNESREVSLAVGVDRVWNARWSTALALGPTWSEFSDESSDVGMSYRASVLGEWPRTQVRLQAEQLLSPSSSRGRLETRDQAGAVLQHRLDERWTADASASFIYYSVPGSSGDERIGPRRYAIAGAGLEWLITPTSRSRIAYTYSRVEDLDVASSHRLVLGLTWKGLGRSVSR